MSEMQAEFEDMKRRVDGKTNESDVIERELRKLQERHREAMAQVHQMNTAREHLEASVRIAQAEIQRERAEFEQQNNLKVKEMAALQDQFSSLIAQNEKLKNERDKGLDKYRTKSTQYKQKLKLALQNL